jgi:hypothetical protein
VGFLNSHASGAVPTFTSLKGQGHVIGIA